jgi:hypothetical protein
MGSVCLQGWKLISNFTQRPDQHLARLTPSEVYYQLKEKQPLEKVQKYHSNLRALLLLDSSDFQSYCWEAPHYFKW